MDEAGGIRHFASFIINPHNFKNWEKTGKIDPRRKKGFQVIITESLFVEVAG